MAGKFMRDYDFRKWKLWTKAFYGGEYYGTGGTTPPTATLSYLSTQVTNRTMTSGMLILTDMGVCSLVGREADFSTCKGQYAANSDIVLVPGIAQKWQQVDPLTWVFTLRKGVMWPAVAPMVRADREVTAEDIKWFIEITKKEGILRDNFTLIQAVEAPDRYTVRVKLSEPLAEFLPMMAHLSLGIFPKECYDEKGCLGSKQISPAPILLKEYTPNQRTVWDKNPEFWLKGIPYIDRFTAVAISDVTAQKAAFSTGKLEHMGFQGPAEALLLAKQTPGSRVQTEGILSGVQAFEPSLAGPFADVRVRRAMAMAMDHKTIWSATEGFNWFPTLVSRHIFGPASDKAPYAFQMSVESQVSEWYKFNPVKAKALLAEAGFPSGFKTTLTTSTCSGANYDMQLVAQANWLKYLNIDMAIRCIDTVQARTVQYENKWGDGLYYLRPANLGHCACADLAIARMVTGSAVNFQKMSDPVIDDLYKKERGELDPAKRLKLLWDYEQYEMSQVYYFRLAWTWGVGVFQPWEINCAGHENTYCGVNNGAGWMSMFDPALYPKDRVLQPK
ncbi:MAG: hypothetical protein EXR67_06625 [Dehalococcoidia bacterium]|nr:hypothetical protein [Dehalococcoidia bacterium]